MRIRRITGEADLWYAERVYLRSFPAAERRDTEAWVRLTFNEPKFRNNVIEDEGRSVGFVSFWDFGTFVYIEHFAIDTTMRGQGLGGKALELLMEQCRMPVVLEVELPTGFRQRRRIAFYERHGFFVCSEPYMQPPYRSGDEGLAMLLMYSGFRDMESAFRNVKNTIYKYVYGCTDESCQGDSRR